MMTLTAATLLLISIIFPASTASATAQTCISAPNGAMCTTVSGEGTYVDTIYSVYDKIVPTNPLLQTCNTRAWFFEISSDGAVHDLGVEWRDGCHLAGRTWLAKRFGRSFPNGSLLCTKFYEHDWQTFIGQRCIGISA